MRRVSIVSGSGSRLRSCKYQNNGFDYGGDKKNMDSIIFFHEKTYRAFRKYIVKSKIITVDDHFEFEILYSSFCLMKL